MSEPPLPRLPGRDDDELPPSEGDRNLATYFAAAALAGTALGLLFLVTMVMPDAIFVLVALALLPAYFLLHYLLWGRLMRSSADDAPDEPPARD